jgi:hypothetical protein
MEFFVKKGNCTFLIYKEALERFLVMVCPNGGMELDWGCGVADRFA